jgi:hypothetical protein
MLREHREIQRWIKRKYGDRFEVLAEIDHQNCLPDRKKGHWYQPDVIMREQNGTKDVRYIIEVENDPMRKVIAGACLLADCCLEKMQKAKAELVFVVFSKGGERQIENFRNKVEFVRHRLPDLSSIQVVTDKEFKQGRGFGIRSTRKEASRPRQDATRSKSAAAGRD